MSKAGDGRPRQQLGRKPFPAIFGASFGQGHSLGYDTARRWPTEVTVDFIDTNRRQITDHHACASQRSDLVSQVQSISMSRTKPTFELPRLLERHLAMLAKLYVSEGKRDHEEIVVNAYPRIEEEWTYDNWNGGTCGHALHLILPEDLYLRFLRQRDDLQTQIAKDLNGLHDVQDEHIAAVFLEIEAADDDDEWRRESALFRSKPRRVSADTTTRIWGTDGYRVFLSHKASGKETAITLKEGLQVFGVSTFVAHKDITPTRQGQKEIEAALASMDAFVAFMCKTFHDSKWTDQEVEYALCRGVPIIALRHGTDPYGFIGRFQALSCNLPEAPQEVVKLLIKHPRMIDAYVAAAAQCESFEAGNKLAELLPAIKALDGRQVKRLTEAFNKSSQLRGSYGFTGEKPHIYGQGLPKHLSRITGRSFILTDRGEIREE